MEGMGVIFGYEIALDLADCNEHIKIEESLRKFALELCQVLDMKPYGEAQTPYFGFNSDITKGYSLLQFIETSAIMGHFSDHHRSAHLNIFSCKPFDTDKAIKFCAKFFHGKIIMAETRVRKCTNG
jgi:S-adenosylmethionine/arginine decarboxylase-like enzyme